MIISALKARARIISRIVLEKRNNGTVTFGFAKDRQRPGQVQSRDHRIDPLRFRSRGRADGQSNNHQFKSLMNPSSATSRLHFHYTDGG